MKLPLEAITVGKRRREDFGDIAGLAESIKTYGLLHPIVVDDEGNLVAGERRLRAVQMLGWETVDVRDLGELTDAERSEIELEENARRKDLTPYERSKTLVRLAQTARTVILSQEEVLPESGKSSGGRPPRADVPLQKIAERIGVPRQTIQLAQQHVDAGERYPELQSPRVTQQAATEIAKSLDVLPEPERDQRREAIRTVGPAALTLSDGETFPTGQLSPEQKAFYEVNKELMKLAKWKTVDPAAVADVPPADVVHGCVVELGKVLDWATRVHGALKAREERPTLRAVES